MWDSPSSKGQGRACIQEDTSYHHLWIQHFDALNEELAYRIEEIPVSTPKVRYSIWKAFGGNTRDLGSFGEETDKTTNQHQDSLRFKVSEPGDGVTIYTRCRHTSSSDGVTTSLDGVSPHRLNSDLEDSTL
ncbi:hypothetical protein Tco_1219601 [Tanacetum coccineum]